MKKLCLAVLAGLLLVAVLVLGRPVAHLAYVWYSDSAEPLPAPAPGHDDHSRMNSSQPEKVVAIEPHLDKASAQLTGLIRQAAGEGRRISISGARHSMGGHTLYPGALVLDMQPFRDMTLDEQGRILTVGAGATWAEVIPFLDRHGLAVAVMQSNNDFTVGGSISVNCHGWQHNSPPISGTVEAFRIITADGTLRHCSRTDNPEIFSLALGGYGLAGVILEVDLRVVPNEFYRAKAHKVKPVDYAMKYAELTRERTDIGMAYGRISVAPETFLEEGLITLLERKKTDQSVMNTLSPKSPDPLKRLVFRGSVGSDYGKNLRWSLEKMLGETAGKLLSRNQIMNEPAEWFSNRDETRTEILHEYFVPAPRIGEFLAAIKPILLRHRPDLLNITIRNVEEDRDTLLRYAREEVFGVVMLFHQTLDPEAEARAQALGAELTAAAISLGGTYYLPYRLYAERALFERAYPMAPEFFARKHQLDPTGVFQNRFSAKYDPAMADSR